MDKQLIEGYIAGIVFIIGSLTIVISTIHTNLMLAGNEIMMAIGVILGILGIGSLVRPESIGQIAAEWARRLATNASESGKTSKDNKIIVSGDVDGDLNIIAGSEDTKIKKTTTTSKKGKTDDEMTLLVAPLYNKSRGTNKKKYFMKGVPGYEDSIYKKDRDYFEFWEKIENYKHLGVGYLRDALQEYIDNKTQDTKSSPDPKYKKAEKKLIEKIEQRYQELIK